MTINEALAAAAGQLAAGEVAEPRREAASLLMFALNRDKAYLVAHSDAGISRPDEDRYFSYIARRASREPFQYITGHQEFYALDLLVTPDVLVPRPETEVLVADAIRLLSASRAPRLLEIGVGSGCISIAALFNVPAASGLAVDISSAALAVARLNVDKHRLANRVTLRTGNVYEGIDGQFDLIASNPPYIPDEQIPLLQPEVGRFEPHSALAGGPGGLDIIRRIVDGAPKLLKADGYLLIEIGFDQAERVKGLFDPAVWQSVDFLTDLQGIERVVRARVV